MIILEFEIDRLPKVKEKKTTRGMFVKQPFIVDGFCQYSHGLLMFVTDG